MIPGLLQPLRSVLFVQLYWLSILCIGWVIVLFLRNRYNNKYFSNWTTLPLAAKILISAAVSFVLFSIFTLIAYGLSLPGWTAAVFYLLCLSGTVWYGWKYCRSIMLSAIKNCLSKLQQTLLISPVGLLLILLVVELGLAFLIGGFIGADGFVHVSKVRHILESGFNLTDAYFGTAPETRHTLSVLHTMIAIPSVFRIDPLSSWYASGLFFKIIKISSVMYLAWYLFYWMKDKIRIQYAALATILSLAIFNNYFTSYPSVFVAAWICLFIIALYEITKNKSLELLIISSILIATTHPIAAVAAALLLVFCFIVITIFDRKFLNKKILLTGIASLLILLSTPLFTAMLPNRMTEFTKNYSANDYSYFHFGPLRAFVPNLELNVTADFFSATPPIVIFLSLLGVAGLFLFIKDKRMRAVSLAVVLFAPLVLFNPLVFTPLEKLLPIWAIARFNTMNQLTEITVFIGLMVITAGIFKLRNRKLNWQTAILPLTLVVTVLFCCLQALGAVDPKLFPNASMYDQQQTVYSSLKEISSALPEEKHAIVLAGKSSDSFMIPVISSLRVLSIDDTHATPAADMNNRTACFEKLYARLNPELLKQTNVGYVLADRNDPVFFKLALQNPRLEKVKETQVRTLYKFNGNGVKSAAEKTCVFNEM